jgi:transposase InsO family protein
VTHNCRRVRLAIAQWPPDAPRGAVSTFCLEHAVSAILEQLQEQVDRFDIIYNTERPHQGLPGRITPLQA